MTTVKTVGELRMLLADKPDTAPLEFWFVGNRVSELGQLNVRPQQGIRYPKAEVVEICLEEVHG